MVMLGLWLAILGSGGKAPLTGDEFVRYYLALIIVNTWTAAWAAPFIASDIRLGKISPNLIRPVPYWIFPFGNNIGEKVMKFAILLFPFILLSQLFHFSLEHFSMIQFTLFIASCIIAAFLTFVVDLSVGLMAFWLDDVTAIEEGMDFSFYIFSGQLIPLIAFPTMLQNVANILPFRYMLSFPVEILTTQLSTESVLIGIAIQLLWMILAIICYSVLWARGVRRYSASGA